MKRRKFLKNASLLASSSVLINHVNAQESEQQTQGAAEVKIKRLSWAGIQIEYDGATLFIDPWVSKEQWGDKWTMPVIEPVSNTSANHIAITHSHNDHLDTKAIRQINGERKGNIYCGIKTASAASSFGLNEVKVAELWEPMLLSGGKMVLTAVPSMDFSGIEQVSWVIQAGGKKLFHGGDGIWHGYFHKIAYGYGPFDIVFMPMNGADVLQLKPLSGIPATMPPHHAAAAATVLGAKLVVPIHYGISNPGVYEEYPNAMNIFLSECKKREVPVEVCEPGSWVTGKSNR